MADLSDDKVFQKLKEEVEAMPSFADTTNYEMSYDSLLRAMTGVIEQYEGVIKNLQAENDPAYDGYIKGMEMVLDSIKAGLNHSN
jgi:molecular chaperone GrpE (heat shock protein)